jgi:hypothetical protein
MLWLLVENQTRGLGLASGSICHVLLFFTIAGQSCSDLEE